MAEVGKFVIKNRAIAEDRWTLLALAEGETAEGVTIPAGDVIVPLAVWLARKDALVTSGQRIAVWLAPNEGPEAIADDLSTGHFGNVDPRAHFRTIDILDPAFPAFVAGKYDPRIVDQILNPPAPEEALRPAAAAR